MQIRAQRAFDEVWKRDRPDVVYAWNLAKLPIALAARAQSRGPIAYYISDAWLEKAGEPGWYQERWMATTATPRGSAQRLAVAATRASFRLGGLTWLDEPLRLEHAQFCSAFLRDAALRAGRHVEHAEVVHWGVDANRFRPAARAADRARTRLLYAGQIVPHKGVHTAIAAVARLHACGYGEVTLTIAGAAHDPEYDARLRAQVTAARLDESVRFIGPQPRERLAGIYREHDVLVFPSCWEEPFAITPLEAMASGLVVVGTPAGGSSEVFDDGVNALTFPEEDAAACASQLQRVISDAAFATDLATRARRTIVERFTLERMVDRIEARLRAATGEPHDVH